VLRIGLEAIRDAVYEGLREVHLVGFTEEECSTLERLGQELFSSSSSSSDVPAAEEEEDAMETEQNSGATDAMETEQNSGATDAVETEQNSGAT
jgi:hypothetical protein